jgi:hypothetical protein
MASDKVQVLRIRSIEIEPMLACVQSKHKQERVLTRPELHGNRAEGSFHTRNISNYSAKSQHSSLCWHLTCTHQPLMGMMLANSRWSWHDQTDATVFVCVCPMSCAVVPPGFYAVRNRAVRCPKGEYRSGYLAPSDSTNKCTRCPRGTTTWGSGSPSIEYCYGKC